MRRARLRLLAVALAILILPLAACQAGPVERFPSVTTVPQPIVTVQRPQPAAAQASNTVTLRVAAPIPAEAAEALRQLYLAFQYGQFTPDSQSPIGDRFEPGGALAADQSLAIRFEYVPFEAVQDGLAMRSLSEKGALPDVFVSGDIGSLAANQAVMDLSSLVDGLDIAAAVRLPVFAMEALKRNGKVLGIPFLASAPLLVWNPALLQRYGLEMPASLDAEGLLRLLERAAGRLAQEQPLPDSPRIAAMADLRPLLSLWPSAIDGSVSCAGWQNGAFQFVHPAVRQTLQLVRGLAPAALNPAESLAVSAYSAGAAREAFLSGQAIFLIDESANLPALMLQSRVPASILPLPSAGFGRSVSNLNTSKSEPGRQAFRITAWCVSAQTAYPAEAARLALFLAQDPDALLLLSRYAPLEGWLPLTHAASVWDRAVARQSQGKGLKSFSGRLNRGTACPSIQVPDFSRISAATLMGSDLLRTDRTVTEADLSALGRTATERLQRDGA